MKTSAILPLLLAAVVLSCQLLDPPLSMNRPRGSDSTFTYVTDTQAVPKPDTSVFVTALCFPSGYDWRRDTLFGNVACSLKLYRNGVRTLALATPPGSGPYSMQDAHHVVDGSLFTVSSGEDGTQVCRDGEPLASWTGSERLCGLLMHGGVLHTLGQGSGGLVYRRGGIEVLRIADGTPFGSFRQDTWGSTGALYVCRDSVCFAFSAVREGENAAYLVCGGEPRQVFSAPDAQILDVKLLGGLPAVLSTRGGVTRVSYAGSEWSVSYAGPMVWIDGGLVLHSGQPAVVGRYNFGEGTQASYSIGFRNASTTFLYKPLYVYYGGGAFVPVSTERDIPAGTRIMNRDCACIAPDGSLTLALTTEDGSVPPYVLEGGRRTEFPVHGFLTSVSYQIGF